MAWLQGYSRRLRLTLQSTYVDAALTDFPVLLRPAHPDFYNVINASALAKKIAVTTSDGQSQCKVELERYLAHDTIYWAKIPAVSSTADTQLFLYYDAAASDNTEYVGDVNSAAGASVWDSNFVLVDHMQDYGDTSHTVDSTSNSNDLTKKGAAEPPQASGKIGYGQDFDGADDYLTRTMNLSGGLTGLTIEIWANGAVADKGMFKTDATAILFHWRGAGFYLTGADATASGYLAWDTKPTPPAFVAASWSNADVGDAKMKLYTDGTKQVTELAFTGGVTKQLKDSTIFRVGDTYNAGQPYFDGVIDEVRVSDIARSDAWIKASYYSEFDQLVAWGNRETLAAAPRRRRRTAPKWNLPVGEDVLRLFRDYLREE